MIERTLGQRTRWDCSVLKSRMSLFISQERYLSLPQFLAIKPDSNVLCTGAAYTIQRFCQAMNTPFPMRVYTENELLQALGDMLLNSTAATTTPSQILPGSPSSISKSCYSKNQAGPRKPASRNKKSIGGTRSGSRAD